MQQVQCITECDYLASESLQQRNDGQQVPNQLASTTPSTTNISLELVSKEHGGTLHNDADLSDDETDENSRFPEIKHLRHLADTVRYFPYAPHVLRYRGSVKLHGTNMGVRQLATGELQVYSRHNRLKLGKDNVGSCAFVHERAITFAKLFEIVRGRTACHDGDVMLFGEFAGQGVQKGVGISNTPKFYAIFCVVAAGRRMDMAYFSDVHANEDRIWNVMQFPTWDLEIPKADVMSVQDIVTSLTEQVGSECPAARLLGCPGKGEGIVWTCLDVDSSKLWFKSKCKEHTVSGAPPKAHDKSAAAYAMEFATTFVTQARLEQGLQYLREMGMPFTHATFLPWVVADVMKEEGSCIPTPKHISECRSAISRVAAIWLKHQMQREAGNA